ncbi:MAG: hypothetical protein KatS3mg059_1145 [Thermomicrobiales bacterium]|nr:MAG: hypothetical protein KatS3mg059_1145 [Thermomicrobiales bacterium]
MLFAPGTYLLGISRSETASGTTLRSDRYRVQIDAGTDLPPPGDPEPNDDPQSAGQVAGAFALSGDREGSDDYVAWTLNDRDAALGWELRAQSAVGEKFSFQLLDETGLTLASTEPAADGRATLYDLGLQPGTYVVRVSSASDSRLYTLEAASTGDKPAQDVEPNNAPEQAGTLDPAHPVIKGRLAGNGDQDVYRLTVDSELASTQLDLKLIWRSGRARQLCLLSETGETLQCKQGTRGVILANMLLPAGTYAVTVSGEPALDDPYLLRLDRTVAPEPGFEREPNDAVTQATEMQPGQDMRGRFDGDERDHFVLHVTGEPQLWQLEAQGSSISKLALYDAQGNELMAGEIAPDGTAARLSDLFLIPGDHILGIAGLDGEYQLRITPAGPPDPNAEREPNNDSARATLLPLGEVRTGRLVESTDVDRYRFTLAAPEHVLIRVEPPPDGAVTPELLWGSDTMGTPSSVQPGLPYTYDAYLPPGDYQLVLRADQASEGAYRVSVERQDPFTPGR